MPSLDIYRRIKGNASTIGQIHKNQSDLVYEMSWERDIDSRIAYFYDQKRDDEYELTDDLHPENSKTKIPVAIKFFEMEYNSLAKDEVGYHIAFKPSFDYKKALPYYDKEYADLTGSIWPIGLYADIPDSGGIFHRYLVVAQYRHYSNQFPSYIVLPCDFKLRWIANQQKNSCWGVLRSQSSYNSGLWTDYRITAVENQKLFWCPYTPANAEIFYDTRCAISGPRKEPIVWSVSKVEDTNVKGILRLTFKQDRWDSHTDRIEYNEDGNYVAAWCNYYKDGVPISDEECDNIPSPIIHSLITYSGLKPELKVKGSARKFMVKFYEDEENENELPYIPGDWEVKAGSIDASHLVECISPLQDPALRENEVLIKFIGGDEWINQNLDVWFITNPENGVGSIRSHICVNIIGM